MERHAEKPLLYSIKDIPSGGYDGPVAERSSKHTQGQST